MCLIKVSKNTSRRKIYKRLPTSFLKFIGVPSVNYLRKMTRISSNEYTFFYKENLSYKSRFSNRKLLHKKTLKTKINIYSEGPFTLFPT